MSRERPLYPVFIEPKLRQIPLVRPRSSEEIIQSNGSFTVGNEFVTVTVQEGHITNRRGGNIISRLHPDGSRSILRQNLDGGFVLVHTPPETQALGETTTSVEPSSPVSITSSNGIVTLEKSGGVTVIVKDARVMQRPTGKTISARHTDGSHTNGKVFSDGEVVLVYTPPDSPDLVNVRYGKAPQVVIGGFRRLAEHMKLHVSADVNDPSSFNEFTFGDALNFFRTEAGLSVREFGRRIYRTGESISTYENGGPLGFVILIDLMLMIDAFNWSENDPRREILLDRFRVTKEEQENARGKARLNPHVE